MSTIKTTLIPRRVELPLLRRLYSKSRLGVEVSFGDSSKAELLLVSTQLYLATIDKNIAKRVEGRALLAF